MKQEVDQLYRRGKVAEAIPIGSRIIAEMLADKKRLGARVGITSVLHAWGSTMMHHPHVHMIVLGGGLSEDGERWIA